jgi:hypothetical protein
MDANSNQAALIRSDSVIPLSQRRFDWLFLGFFLLNFFFITYMVDLEQLMVPDPSHYQPPIWPPVAMINLVHSYGTAFDPLLMARPVWWKMTIWLDVAFYGPFYAFAIYAFVRGREWIRIPALFYSGMMFADVFIILGEEMNGPHAAPNLPVVVMLNLPWLLMPLLLTYRMRREHPFTRVLDLSSTDRISEPLAREPLSQRM